MVRKRSPSRGNYLTMPSRREQSLESCVSFQISKQRAKRLPAKKNKTANIQTWGSLNAIPTSRQLKPSIDSSLPVAPSSLSSEMTYRFSSSVKKRACAGELGRRIYEKRPKTNVKRPSRIKIHAQPGRFPTPSMLIIPNASKPEKAPEIEAAEKKAEILGTIFSIL